MTEESVPLWQGVTALQPDREYIVRYIPQKSGYSRTRILFCKFMQRNIYTDMYLFRSDKGEMQELYVDEIISIEDFSE